MTQGVQPIFLVRDLDVMLRSAAIMASKLTAEDDKFLGEFFRSVVEDKPLDSEDPRYVPLYEGDGLLEDDPVELLAKAIRYSGESAQLLAGFRGIGKSTELRRLKKNLEKNGHKVALLDLQDYLNQSTPVDVSDFLMAVAGAFGEAIEDESLLGRDMLEESYWDRAVAFMQTRIELTEALVELGGKSAAGMDAAATKVNAEGSARVQLKANLKEDPTFKRQLQEKLAGHLGALVANVRKFIEDCLKAFKTKYGNEVKVVVLVDSVEHIRGTSINAEPVQSSIETLFAGHSDKLKLPGLHVVYTIPPFLKVRFPNLGTFYGAGAVQMFPAVKIRDKEDSVDSQLGIETLRKVITQRHKDALRLLNETQMDKIIRASGGHLRDMLRIVAEVIRRVKVLPATDAVIESALNQIRIEALPIAEDDAVWLARIAKTHGAALETRDDLTQLARFFDTNMVLCYRNGPEWYDVHPLIKKHVEDIAKKAEERQREKAPKA